MESDETVEIDSLSGFEKIPLDEAKDRYTAKPLYLGHRLLLSEGQQLTSEYIKFLRARDFEDIEVKNEDDPFVGNNSSSVGRVGVLEKKILVLENKFEGSFNGIIRAKMRKELLRDFKDSGEKTDLLLNCINEEYSFSWDDYRSAPKRGPDEMVAFYNTFNKLYAKHGTADMDTLEKSVKSFFERNMQSCLSADSLTFPDSLIDIEAMRQLQPDNNFYHSLRVGIRAGIIAMLANMRHKFKGIKYRYNLDDAFMAGLFHDCGKLDESVDQITRKDKWTSTERQSYEWHTVLGQRLLNRHKDLSREVALCALEHHENYNGTGYPSKKKASLIGSLSGLIHIADTLDDLNFGEDYGGDGSLTLVTSAYGNASTFDIKFRRLRYDYNENDISSDPFYVPLAIALSFTDYLKPK